MITVNKWIFEFTSQAAHVCVAAIVMTVFHHHIRYGSLIAFIVGTITAAIKEFWWDYKYEDVATRGSSLLDFSMYLVGLIGGFFV